MTEKYITEVLGGLGLAILGALTGHNYTQIGKLREKIPEKYRVKEDCILLCDKFDKIFVEIKKDMNEGFNRLYDKIDEKEDKG